jgi:ABC-type lipoprotein export system ATPase subunit
MTILKFEKGQEGCLSFVKILERPKEKLQLDIRILLIGESGSGKTTFFNVLSTGEPDTGKKKEKTLYIDQKYLCLDSFG